MAKDTPPKKRDPWVPLRKNYPYSERVNAVNPLAECLFLRLIALVDDQSAFYADPARLRSLVFALRPVSVTKTARARDELVTQGLVELYGDDQYLVIANPLRFPRPDVKRDIRFPPPPQELIERGPDAGRMRDECGPLDVDVKVKVDVKDKREKKGAREDELPPEVDELPPEVGGAGLPPAAPKTTDDDPGAIMAFQLEFFKAFPAANPAMGSRLPGWSPRGDDNHRGWAKWVREQDPALLRSITAADLSQAKRWGDEKKWGWGPGTLLKYLEQKKPQTQSETWFAKATEESKTRAPPHGHERWYTVDLWALARELADQDRLRAGKE